MAAVDGLTSPRERTSGTPRAFRVRATGPLTPRTPLSRTLSKLLVVRARDLLVSLFLGLATVSTVLMLALTADLHQGALQRHAEPAPPPLVIVAPLLPMSGPVAARQLRAVYSWTQLDTAHPPYIYLSAARAQHVDDLKTQLHTKAQLQPRTLSRIRFLGGVRYKTFPADDHFDEASLPFISDLIERTTSATRRLHSNPIFAYINPDIVLYPEFIESARMVDRSAPAPGQFLLFGQRYELDMRNDPPAALTPPALDQLRQRTLAEGRSAGAWFIDFLVFGGATWDGRVPDFVVGRPKFDNFLVANARGVRVDGSRVIVATHQTHNYAHTGMREAAAADARSGQEAPLIHMDNPGKRYNDDLVVELEARGAARVKSWRTGVSGRICVKLYTMRDGGGLCYAVADNGVCDAAGSWLHDQAAQLPRDIVQQACDDPVSQKFLASQRLV